MIIFLSDQKNVNCFIFIFIHFPYSSKVYISNHPYTTKLQIKKILTWISNLQASKDKAITFTCITKLVHPGLAQTHIAARTFKGDAEHTGNHSRRLRGSWEGRVTDLDWIQRHTHLFELLHTHSITGLSHYRTSNPKNPKHWYANPVPSGAAHRQRAPARIPAVPARTPASCRSPGGSGPRCHQLKLWAGTCNFWSGEFEERTRLLPAGMEDSYQRWDY